jgi:hypothetical protein
VVEEAGEGVFFVFRGCEMPISLNSYPLKGCSGQTYKFGRKPSSIDDLGNMENIIVR